MKLKTEFQDEDFKLGEVADVNIATMPDGRIKAQAVAKSGGVHTFFYDDLKTFTDDWEDVPEEPKTEFYITAWGDIREYTTENERFAFKQKLAIGNYFETREEAEKTVEKLKALKRLEDKGFKVDLWDYDGGNYQERIKTGRILFRVKDYEENDKDLDLLFCPEENI